MDVTLFARCIVCLLALAVPAQAADVELAVELDPATRAFSAVIEVPKPTSGERFGLHPSLSVRRSGLAGEGRLRIEYGGTLPRLDPGIDQRGVLGPLGPMVSERGSFLPAASAWYPAPDGRFSYRVSVTVKGGHKALVPGRLVSEAQAGDVYRATFELAMPAEGIDLMAGPYEVRERRHRLPTGAEVRLRTYFFHGMDALSAGYLDDSVRYLERYSARIGPYPFSEFSIVASPLPTGFGMPTLTYLGAAVLKLPFIRATSLGHEVLHNWWGNGVQVDIAQGNWSEGLTTFMADYAFREDASAERAREMRLGWLRDLAAAPAAVPLSHFRTREHGVAAVSGYAKAAMVFLMLRDLIGEAAFDKALRGFWTEHQFQVAGWAELRRAFEDASGASLGSFFEQWLERSDAPAPAIADARYLGGKLQLVVEQPAPPYALRLPVELARPDRRETRVISIQEARQAVTLEAGSRPQSVRLDPDLRVWRRLGRDELPPILRQWILAPAPGLEVVGKDPELSKAAEGLAKRLFESPYRSAKLSRGKPAEAPVLLVGLHSDIDARLAALNLPPRPPRVAGKGTAQVWTIEGTNIAVVSARDVASVTALERPLLHYGAQSYLAFEGARAIERGAWPPAVRAVDVGN